MVLLRLVNALHGFLPTHPRGYKCHCNWMLAEEPLMGDTVTTDTTFIQEAPHPTLIPHILVEIKLPLLGWDGQREYHGNIYTTIRKIDNQW